MLIRQRNKTAGCLETLDAPSRQITYNTYTSKRSSCIALRNACDEDSQRLRVPRFHVGAVALPGAH